MNVGKFEKIEILMEQEILSNYLQDYCSSSDMPDKKTKKLFDKALKHLNKFEKHIKKEAEKEKEEELN